MKYSRNKNVVVYVINTLQVGGAAKILKFVIKKTRHLFEKVYVITTDDDMQMDLGENVIHVHNRVTSSVMKKGVWRATAIKNIRMVINEVRPLLVFAFISDIAVTARLATLGQKIIFISAERGDPYTLPVYWKPLVKFTYACSNYCIFQTETARDFFSNNVAKKSFVIPNPYIKERGVLPYYGERKKTIVSAGRFSSEKCFDLLIQAFAMVHQKHPSYRLILYGDGQEREYYEDLVRDLGIGEHVSFPGYVENIPSHIREEGIFVLSSKYEGIPNALIEAMSMGLPTVSTDCTPGGPRYLTDNGRRGALVPVGDVGAMVKAITNIIESPELATEYSEMTKEIIPLLDADIIGERWVDVINSIMNNKTIV